MALFQKNKFVWTEPWFFCQRIRNRRGWVWIAGAGVAVAILLFCAIFFTRPQAGIAAAVTVACIAGGVIWMIIEAPQMRREISIDESSISAFGNAGQYSSHWDYPLKKIMLLQIVRAHESELPCAFLSIQSENDYAMIGIPASIRLERLAQTLHQLNLPVTLSGWQPAIDPDFDQNEFLYVAADEQPSATATVAELAKEQQGLVTPGVMALAALVGFWAYLVWLGVIIYVGVLVYQNWNALSTVNVLLIGMLGFFSFIIPHAYFERIGNYLAYRITIRAGRKAAMLRPDPLIDVTASGVQAVELILRETWDATAPKVIDYGFLKMDRQRQELHFEGNKERWVVPFTAIRLIKVHEVQYGTAGDSATGQLRCYVILVFQKPNGPYEIGLRPAEQEPGKPTDDRRMRKAVALFEYLSGSLDA